MTVPSDRDAFWAGVLAIGAGAFGVIYNALVLTKQEGVNTGVTTALWVVSAIGVFVGTAMAFSFKDARHESKDRTIAGLPVKADGTVGKTPEEAVRRR